MTSPYLKGNAPPKEGAGRALAATWMEIRRQLSLLCAGLFDRASRLPMVGRFLPKLGIVTSFGWMVLVLALLSWRYGRQRDWEELVALSILLGTVWIGAVVWTIGRVRYRVSMEIANKRVVVGSVAVGNLDVANEASRRCYPSVVEVPVGSTVAQFAVPSLQAHEMHSDVFMIPTQRRGVIAVGPVRSVRGDGLGLFRRVQQWTKAHELYVHPRTINIATSTVGFIRDVEGAVTQDLSSSDVAFHALREYQAGDDRRAVHWRSTARTGTLMVRQFEETRRAHLLLIFDNDASSWSSDEEYELGISVAASIGSAVMRERRELSFISQNGLISSSSPQVFLDGVTLLEAGENIADLPLLARGAVDRIPNASVIILVTGSLTDPSQLHRAYSYLPVNAKSYAMRISESEKMSRTLMGNFGVITIPDLDSLPLVMHKAVS